MLRKEGSQTSLHSVLNVKKLLCIGSTLSTSSSNVGNGSPTMETGRDTPDAGWHLQVKAIVAKIDEMENYVPKWDNHVDFNQTPGDCLNDIFAKLYSARNLLKEAQDNQSCLTEACQNWKKEIDVIEDSDAKEAKEVTMKNFVDQTGLVDYVSKAKKHIFTLESAIEGLSEQRVMALEQTEQTVESYQSVPGHKF